MTWCQPEGGLDSLGMYPALDAYIFFPKKSKIRGPKVPVIYLVSPAARHRLLNSGQLLLYWILALSFNWRCVCLAALSMFSSWASDQAWMLLREKETVHSMTACFNHLLLTSNASSKSNFPFPPLQLAVLCLCPLEEKVPLCTSKKTRDPPPLFPFLFRTTEKAFFFF